MSAHDSSYHPGQEDPLVPSGFLDSALPHVAYQAALSLLPPDDPSLPARKARLFADPRVEAMLKELKAWPGPVLSSHKSARQLFHKLVFLSDIGLDSTHPAIPPLMKSILAMRSPEGIPWVNIQISPAHGGSGESGPGWALCDAPSVLFALARLGVPWQEIRQGVDHLAQGIRDNGFGCRVSPSLGSWRGPGKKADPCPYATLIMLKLLNLRPQDYQAAIQTASHSLLDLWEHSRMEHPYMFYMGTDFRKPKLPFIWYDLLHVTEVLSQVPACRQDPRLLEMYACLEETRGPDGYVPASVYQEFRDWDFGQKKTPSPWMGFCVWRIGKRLERP